MNSIYETMLLKYPNVNPDDIRVAKSPLRICPFGAHIDHQCGVVAGMALNISVDLAYAPADDGYMRVQSIDFPNEDYFHIDNVPAKVGGFWGNYLRGAVLALKRSHILKRGIYGVIKGNYPIGGLSSSAAVITAYLLALCDANGIELTKQELILNSHWVESVFIGLKNGMLDQSINVLSKNGFLTLVDTKTADYELIPKPANTPDFAVAIVYSGLTKALIGTDYNNHVDECNVAAWILREQEGLPLGRLEDTKLRDIDYEVYLKHREKLAGRFRKRADHFFGEIIRVNEGAKAWSNGDLPKMGKLMLESGESSINNYCCGSPELISIFEILKNTKGVYGARFSGAGFRGCCAAIVDPDYMQSIKQAVDSEYPQKHPA